MTSIGFLGLHYEIGIDFISFIVKFEGRSLNDVTILWLLWQGTCDKVYKPYSTKSMKLGGGGIYYPKSFMDEPLRVLMLQKKAKTRTITTISEYSDLYVLSHNISNCIT